MSSLPSGHRSKGGLVIRYINKTGHSITNFIESPFAGKHPELIQKGTKAAAAEAAVTAAEAMAVAGLEGAKRLAAKFEALGGGALTQMRQHQLHSSLANY